MKQKGKKVLITSFFSQGDKDCEAYEECIKTHRLFVPEATHPVPPHWIVNTSEVGIITRKPLSKGKKYELFKEVRENLTPVSNQILEIFDTDEDEVFSSTFPIAKASKEKGCTILSKYLPHSEKVLYRLLHWVGEIQVKKGDFYKGHLLSLALGNTGAVADFFFFKKEISCELWCPKRQCIPPKNPPVKRGGFSVSSDIPGIKIKGRPTAKPEVLEKWNLLLKILQTKTLIYPGNNFTV